MPSPVSGTAEMVAGSIVRLPMDLGDEPRLVKGAAVVGGVLVLQFNIASFDVTCAEVGAPTISRKQLDYPYVVSAEFSGGTSRPGTPYNIIFSIILDDADATKIVRVAPLRVY